jgi:hypothetical protein
MKRTIIAIVASAAILSGPAALAYPQGGCAAPENWPAGSESIYVRTCGISLDQALAQKAGKQARPAAPKGSSATPIAPSAASIGVIGTGLVLASRRRQRASR